MNSIPCDYCQRNAPLVSSAVVYGKCYGPIYYCKPCHAWVGVHKGTTNPLGRLANSCLRYWKKRAHAAFDPIWKSGDISRKEAYAWLGRNLGLRRHETHIGMFDVDKCKAVVELVAESCP